MKKIFISGETYFNLCYKLTHNDPHVWANNEGTNKVLIKLLQGYEKNRVILLKLKMDWNDPDYTKNRKLLEKKFNQSKKGFYVSFDEQEIYFLNDFYELKELIFIT